MSDRINFRKAVPDDAELLFAWANDMDVRRNAFSQHEITWDEHAAWFGRKLADQDCCIYIAYKNRTDRSEEPVGQIRLDIEAGIAEIDYSVCEQMRGMGYGTQMINAVQSIADERIHTFAAKVKKSNPASAKVFEKCGFIKTAEKETYAEFQKERKSGSAVRPSIVVCTQKSWNAELAEELKKKYDGVYDVCVITKKEELCPQVLKPLAPDYIFFPHWSYIIPESVFEAYPCVVFHMTDLPFGRGGSPLQNLIVRGFTHTKLSAIRVDKGLDTGDIYGKEELDLSGSADEILRRASELIFSRMIPYILENRPEPVPQSGEAVVFKRRNPEEGRLLPNMDLQTVYDYIRMLDGEGYPPAFLEFGDHVLRFTKAELSDGRVKAEVTIEKKENNA